MACYGFDINMTCPYLMAYRTVIYTLIANLIPKWTILFCVFSIGSSISLDICILSLIQSSEFCTTITILYIFNKDSRIVIIADGTIKQI